MRKFWATMTIILACACLISLLADLLMPNQLIYNERIVKDVVLAVCIVSWLNAAAYLRYARAQQRKMARRLAARQRATKQHSTGR